MVELTFLKISGSDAHSHLGKRRLKPPKGSVEDTRGILNIAFIFISAKEALATRLQESKGLPPQISTEDYFPRYLEFQAFEKRFTDCLSRAAVSTKFAQHSR